LGIGSGAINAWFPSLIFTAGEVGLIAIAALLMVRRRWNRFLVITEHGLSVPSGFLRLRPRTIGFASIQRVWVTRLFATDILRVRTPQGELEIHDIYLPESKVLWELKGFLESKAGQRGHEGQKRVEGVADST
jgi:hypothetical protein